MYPGGTCPTNSNPHALSSTLAVGFGYDVSTGCLLAVTRFRYSYMCLPSNINLGIHLKTSVAMEHLVLIKHFIQTRQVSPIS